MIGFTDPAYAPVSFCCVCRRSLCSCSKFYLILSYHVLLLFLLFLFYNNGLEFACLAISLIICSLALFFLHSMSLVYSKCNTIPGHNAACRPVFPGPRVCRGFGREFGCVGPRQQPLPCVVTKKEEAGREEAENAGTGGSETTKRSREQEEEEP